MKKISVLFAAILLAAGVAAQNPTAYFMEGSTLRSQFNPAFAPARGYFNIPGLGGIQANVSGNLALDNILFPYNGSLVTVLSPSITASQALSGLKSNNTLSLDSRVNILGFGAYTSNRQSFWSFDVNLRSDFDTQLPYELFEFAKTGASNNIGNIGTQADAYLEAGFNYSFPLLDQRLYIGARAKFLVGLVHAKLRYDRFDVSLDEDRWTVDASGTLDVIMAGTSVETETSDDGRQIFTPGDLDAKFNKPAGYGFAIDLGATYDILPNLQASLALTDLGFISWSKKDAIAGNSSKQLEFEGVEVPDNGQPQPDFDLNVFEFEPATPRGGARMLRASINAGAEYKICRNKLGFGLLYTARLREYRTLHNITASVNYTPIHWFTLSGSYSAIANRGGAVGLAMNVCPGWINFFLATDLLTTKHTPQWVPVKQSTMNVTLGLGIPMGKRGHRPFTYDWTRNRW